MHADNTIIVVLVLFFIVKEYLFNRNVCKCLGYLDQHLLLRYQYYYTKYLVHGYQIENITKFINIGGENKSLIELLEIDQEKYIICIVFQIEDNYPEFYIICLADIEWPATLPDCTIYNM